MTWAVAVSNTSSRSLVMSMGDQRKLWNLNKLGGQRWGTTVNKKRKKITQREGRKMIGRNTSKVLKRYIWDARCIKYKQGLVLGCCCIKYKQQVQLRWRDDNQTTFVWHVTLNSKKLSATMTTDHTTLTHWQGHPSCLYSIQRFLLHPTVTCIWYSD